MKLRERGGGGEKERKSGKHRDREKENGNRLSAILPFVPFAIETNGFSLLI